MNIVLLSDMLSCIPWFSTGGDFPSEGAFGNSWRH